MSAKDGMLAIRQLQPDLVFLDINMPWMSGIEMLEVLGDINFEVVFTTAHDKYAVQAFRLSAIDYLLKPVDYQDLIVAIARVSEKRNHISPEHLSSLKENLSPATQPQRIGVSTQDGVDFNIDTGYSVL
ncbi:MAG: response regulator [Saprospiraceae bacterium]